MKFLRKYKPWLYIFIILASIVILYKVIDSVDALYSWGKNIVDALNPFIIGFVIAYLLNQPCKSVSKLCRKSKLKFLKNHADGVGVFVVYFAIIILITVIILVILPALSENVTSLFSHFRDYVQEVINFINSFQDKTNVELINTKEFSVEKIVEFFVRQDAFSQVGKYAAGVISGITSIFDIIIAVIVSVYMCLDKKRISFAVKRVISIIFIKKHSENIFEYLAKINEIFSKYIYCKLIEGLIIATLSTIILSFLKVEYALILGIMIGILNFIPYFGSIISTIITVLITLVSTGPWEALWAAVLLLVMEQIDGNFIGPKIIGDMLDMRPLLVIFSVTIGGTFFGVLGMLLSAPVAMVIKMIIKDLLLNREKKVLQETKIIKDEKNNE